jgi:hypothetical protein
MCSRLAACTLAGVILCGSLAGCTEDEGGVKPIAFAVERAGAEDSPVPGQLVATAVRDSVTYMVVTEPGHGSIVIDRVTGRFEYTPNADFFGTDSFEYAAFNNAGTSKPARVGLTISPVNDPPVLAAIPVLTNSATELMTRYVLDVSDVDGDELSIRVSAADPTVASAAYDPATRELVIEPLQYGKTAVVVDASDAELSTQRETTFSVEDVTQTTEIAQEDAHAVALRNRSQQSVSFRFLHNQFPVFKSDADMLDYVASMPRVFEGEPFERVLWRFVRNNVYHSVPLSAESWHDDPWVVVSSLGWGFCSNVAGTYVRLARAAGYEARVWGLTGHVVPEIKVDGRWQMFDPDLSVYYYTADNEIASVADLVNDSSLITNPPRPVLDRSLHSFPYSELIASFYASAADNYLADAIFVADQGVERNDLMLPPNAVFIYPGNWTTPPIGYDGNVPYEIPLFLQGNLTLPEGWTGTVPSPWLIAAIRGDGAVRLGEQTYRLGSEELETALGLDQRHYSSVEIIESNAPIEVIMFMNAIRYQLASENRVSLIGKDVWRIQAERAALDPAAAATTTAQAFLKPRTIAR